MVDGPAAAKTIRECMETHQKWVDYWLRHNDGECACGLDHAAEMALAGDRAHHEKINGEYENVLSVINCWMNVPG